MTRQVAYITGTRADFGLMVATLRAIHDHPDLRLGIVATGMHLSQAHGHTLGDIVATGLPVLGTVPVEVDPPTGATMARNIGQMLQGFVDILQRQPPDIVLLLGDRGEMLAGALAAIHLNIPAAHIHGGERSGTVDEPVRHAISKLSHLHFTATADARERLVRMGESPGRIWVSGAPGLDGLVELADADRGVLAGKLGLDAARPIALMAFHPVLQEAAGAAAQVRAVLDGLLAHGLQIVAVQPNADAGSDAIRQALEAAAARGTLQLVTHFARDEFVAWMAAADVMVGNSSAGIIEAASFGTPVVNIGTRQNLRERNGNVADCPAEADAIAAAVGRALAHGRFERTNVYGDGHAAARIAARLASEPLGAGLLMKSNAY